MIRFKEIRYKNFLASGNYWTTVKIDEAPMTLVVGTNGAGKSTLLDAICFVNFGKPFRKFNKSDVVNSINKKDCCVVEVIDIHGDSYEVERGVAPSVFKITKNGEPVKITGDKETQAYWDSVFGYTHKTFTQIAILGASSFVPFMKLEAKDRRSIVENVLDIEVFSAMSELTKDKLKVVKNNLTLLGSETTTLSAQLVSLKRAKIESQSNFQEQLDNCNAEIDKAKLLVADYEGQINVKLENITEESKSRAKASEFAKLKVQIESKLNSLMIETKFVTNHKDCPTCKQTVNEDFRNYIIQKNQPKIDEYSKGLKLLAAKVSKLDEEINRIDSVKGQINQIRMMLSAANSSISTNQRSMTLIKSKMNEGSELDKDIDNTSNALAEKNTKKAELEEEQKYLLTAATMLKDDGIKSLVIKEYLPVINQTVNDNLKILDFFVNIEFDEEFNESMKSRHRDSFSYEHFSEGERRRIDLAILLTWRAITKMKARMDTNLLVMDEILDSSLDIEGLNGLMDNIEKFYENYNVFVISHKGDVFADRFSRTIRFEKVDNFSRIITE